MANRFSRDSDTSAGRALETFEAAAINRKFEEAVTKIDDRSSKLAYDTLMATYNNSAEDKKRLIRLSDKFNSSFTTAGYTVLGSIVTGVTALHGLLSAIDSHTLTNGPYITGPLTALLVAGYFSARKEARKTVKAIEADIEKAEAGEELGYKKPALLPAPAPEKPKLI